MAKDCNRFTNVKIKVGLGLKVKVVGQTTCKWFSGIYPVSNDESTFSSITEFVIYALNCLL